MKLPSWIVDRLLRRRARLHETPLDRFSIRIAHTVEEHEDAFKLVHAAYVYEGIASTRLTEQRITPQHVLPESTIFVAYEGDLLVGTMTVTYDSQASIPVARDFPREINKLRAEGATLVEYGSLAVVRRCLASGVTNLLNMAATWFSINVLGATHCAIGIHPRVSPYYRAVYNFRPFAEPKAHADLGAPVIGMVQDVTTFPEFLRRRYRQPLVSGLLPADHFADTLPPCVEIPEGATLATLVRWKLPRDVFRQVFIEQHDVLTRLDQATRSQLAGWRTCKTTEPVVNPRLAG